MSFLKGQKFRPPDNTESYDPFMDLSEEKEMNT